MIFRQVASALAGALVLAGVMAADANAQRRDRFDPEWVLLGEKSVGFRVDRDVINIGQGEDWYRDRRFRQLRFVAERNDVHMMSIRLVYFNGFGEDFRVDRLIRQGEDLPIDLRGDRSFIRRIEMVYRSRPDFRGEAVIKVFGEPSRRGPPGPPPGPMPGPAAWVELGCQQVSLFGKDRDTIRVGRREGRFKAIRLHARGADVELLRRDGHLRQRRARRSSNPPFPQAGRLHPAAGPEGLATSHRPGGHGLQDGSQLQRPGDGVRRRPAVGRGAIGAPSVRGPLRSGPLRISAPPRPMNDGLASASRSIQASGSTLPEPNTGSADTSTRILENSPMHLKTFGIALALAFVPVTAFAQSAAPECGPTDCSLGGT